MNKAEEIVKYNHSEDIGSKKGIYTICFVLLCLIDQIVGSAMGKVQHIAINCTGLIIAVVIFTGCHWKEFMRIPYAVWTVLCVFGGSYAIHWGSVNYDNFGRWVTAVLNVVVYGYLMLRIFVQVFAEKKLPRMNWRAFLLWIVMMLCMVLSKNEALWPLWFLVMFGCFYLTEYSKEELNALFTGMLNGIIIGFFILQGFATMYRAFDEVRYTGIYTNSNMNALFYLMVQAAILGKWYQFKRNGAAVGWRILAGTGSGILFAYCFLTIGRTAMIAMLINTILLIVMISSLEKKRRFLKAVGRLAAVLLAAVVSFPVVFSSVRTIPSEFYAAMTLAGDTSGKIQGMVPFWDERYIEMDEFLEAALGRLFWFLHPEEEEEGDQTDVLDMVGRISDFLVPSLKVQAAEGVPEGSPEENKTWGSGLTQDDPVLTDPEDIVNPVKIRWGIYKAYLGRLNFRGHESSEDKVWLTEDVLLPHAHNFLIQIMFSHGIVTGILFLGVIVFAFLHCMKQCLKKPRGVWFFAVGIFMISAFVGFGMLEIDWRLGQLSFTALFVVQYFLYHRCPEELQISEGTDEGCRVEKE